MKIGLMELLAGIESGGASRLSACWLAAAFAENGYNPAKAWPWLVDNGMSSHVRHGFEQVMEHVLTLPAFQRGYVEGWDAIAKWWAHSQLLEWIPGEEGVCVRPMIFAKDGSRVVRVKPDPCEFVSLETAVKRLTGKSAE
jgi:hypothetical protein